MEFKYFAGEQRSPEWFKLRLGKVTASRLGDWLAVSKRDGETPLKKRFDYERELMFERQFGVNYDNYVSEAMQDGVDYEAFARNQYQQITGNRALECGAWHNGFFVASPDGTVTRKGNKTATGLLEIKILRDDSFSEILETGKLPDDHWKQVQGQMFASGMRWTDYVAVNLKTKKIKIIHVKPDKEFFEVLEERVKEPLSVEEFDTDNVYDFTEEAEREEEPALVKKTTETEESDDTLGDLGF